MTIVEALGSHDTNTESGEDDGGCAGVDEPAELPEVPAEVPAELPESVELEDPAEPAFVELLELEEVVEPPEVDELDEPAEPDELVDPEEPEEVGETEEPAAFVRCRAEFPVQPLKTIQPLKTNRAAESNTSLTVMRLPCVLVSPRAGLLRGKAC